MTTDFRFYPRQRLDFVEQNKKKQEELEDKIVKKTFISKDKKKWTSSKESKK